MGLPPPSPYAYSSQHDQNRQLQLRMVRLAFDFCASLSLFGCQRDIAGLFYYASSTTWYNHFGRLP